MSTGRRASPYSTWSTELPELVFRLKSANTSLLESTVNYTYHVSH